MSLAGICFPSLCVVYCSLFVVDVVGWCVLFDAVVCCALLIGGCCNIWCCCLVCCILRLSLLGVVVMWYNVV